MRSDPLASGELSLPLADLLRLLRDEVDRGAALGQRSAHGLELSRIRIRMGVAPSPATSHPWAPAPPPRPVLESPALLERTGWQLEMEFGGEGLPKTREAPAGDTDPLRDRNIGLAFAGLPLSALREMGEKDREALASLEVESVGQLATLDDEVIRLLSRRKGGPDPAVHQARARLLYQWLPPLPDPGRRNPRLRGLLGLTPTELLQRLGVEEDSALLAAAGRISRALVYLAVALTDEALTKITYKRICWAQGAR
jgi:hypothetical protein